MVAQLQTTPTDNALPENIIKLAAEMKAPPAIPEDATRNFVRGNTFQKEAKSRARDFQEVGQGMRIRF
jgi:hypothetical protein